MKRLGILLFAIGALSFGGQQSDIRYSAYKTDAKISDPFFSTYAWDYPWWVIRNEDGTFENTLGNSLSAKDTAHLIFTANCISSHQGEHPIRYGYASLKNNELSIQFSDGEPAYFTSYFLYIRKKEFGASMEVNYVFPTEHLDIRIRTIRQELTLNKNYFRVGDTVKGKVDLVFVEEQFENGKRNSVDTSFFAGVFRIPIGRTK